MVEASQPRSLFAIDIIGPVTLRLSSQRLNIFCLTFHLSIDNTIQRSGFRREPTGCAPDRCCENWYTQVCTRHYAKVVHGGGREDLLSVPNFDVSRTLDRINPPSSPLPYAL